MWKTSLLGLFSVAFITAACLSAKAADEAVWKVGLAERKITPQKPIYLAGYAGRIKPFETIESDLYAKAMMLEDQNRQRAILITSDLIGFRASFAEPICQRISEKTGIPRSHILINSSHTHTGPTLSLDENDRWSNMTAEQARDVVEYTRKLMDDVVEVAIEATEKPQPARLSYGFGVALFVMNRREPTPQGVRLGFNPSGLADRSVPVLRIDSTDGKLLAVLFGAACHNTTLGTQDYMVSGDYAGYAQESIESKHPGATAMFMAGCGGSANPWPRGSIEISRGHGKQLGDEVCRVLETRLKPVAGPLRVEFDMVELPLAEPPSPARLEQLRSAQGGSWQARMAERMLERLAEGKPLESSYSVPLSVWQFGGDLTLVALPGEVVADYVPLVQHKLGPLDLWIAAYCYDVFGYVPAARTLVEGGYETRGMYYGGIGFFSPQVEEVLVNKVAELARRAGKPIAPPNGQ